LSKTNNIKHNHEDIKNIFLNLGADLCGIAPVERFKNAPEGFHPTDIYEKCNSVIVFAKKLPPETLFAKSTIPYSYFSDKIGEALDFLSIEASYKLEKKGIKAVPVPSNSPYDYYDQTRLHGQALLSMRHAGHLAGLGVLGKNTLLINKIHGNIILISAVLVDVVLEGDPIYSYKEELCPASCNLCLDVCPQKALDGTTVVQALCRPLSTYKTGNNSIVKKCNLCRRVCPSNLGLKS